MRKIFEFIGGFALIAFSFYFTDRVSLMVASKSELMQEIKSVSATYETSPVDAVIDEKTNSITPGRFGKVVNSQESYLSMHDFGSFNENYLVFDYIEPNTSLTDHKDKFIVSGNPQKRNISLIVSDNEEIETYLNEAKINYNILLDKYEDTPKNVEIINTSNNKNDFNSINGKLETNKKLCLKDKSNLDLCKKNSYFLINPKIELTNTNLIEVKNNINPGSIILLSSSVKLENVKLLMNEIDYKDLNIVFISELIDEKAN